MNRPGTGSFNILFISNRRDAKSHRICSSYHAKQYRSTPTTTTKPWSQSRSTRAFSWRSIPTIRYAPPGTSMFSKAASYRVYNLDRQPSNNNSRAWYRIRHLGSSNNREIRALSRSVGSVNRPLASSHSINRQRRCNSIRMPRSNHN